MTSMAFADAVRRLTIIEGEFLRDGMFLNSRDWRHPDFLFEAPFTMACIRKHLRSVAKERGIPFIWGHNFPYERRYKTQQGEQVHTGWSRELVIPRRKATEEIIAHVLMSKRAHDLDGREIKVGRTILTISPNHTRWVHEPLRETLADEVFEQTIARIIERFGRR